jgi:hypothetical protein
MKHFQFYKEPPKRFYLVAGIGLEPMQAFFRSLAYEANEIPTSPPRNISYGIDTSYKKILLYRGYINIHFCVVLAGVEPTSQFKKTVSLFP